MPTQSAMIAPMAVALSIDLIRRAHDALAATLGANRVSISTGDREQHARDQSTLPARMPDLVVWPETTAHVSTVLRYANDHELPVTAWGAGTSLEGNPIPIHGGILLDFQRMNRVLAVH